MKFLIALSVTFTLSIGFLYSLNEHKKLTFHSLGSTNDKNSKVGVAEVISMGRDDDDGKALKWHIGGSEGL